MIITLKGVQDIYAKVKDNHSRRMKTYEDSPFNSMPNWEKADYRDIEHLLHSTISTYEDIQNLTDEVIRIKFKSSEVTIISNYILHMDNND